MRRYVGQGMIPARPGLIVVGGQWGSEGKGAFIHEIAQDYGTHVRVGGPQAGHSVKLGPEYSEAVLKLQTIPVGAASGKSSIIGMASVVDMEVLAREVGWFQELGIPLDLVVDGRATVMPADAQEVEKAFGLNDRLGSTGKGVGAARAARIMRTAQTVWEYAEENPLPGGVAAVDTSPLIWQRLLEGQVLVEAAQGVLLSLFSSGYYPFVTSAEATAAGAFADLGLPLRLASEFEVCGVFRTYPIRVAGNSGPLPRETTWEAIEARRGAEIAESEKMTTVTRKIRRVAEWDAEVASRAVRRYGIDWAVLSFLDYPFPEIAGETDYDKMPARVKGYVEEREQELGVPIFAVGTGFGSYAWLR